MIYVVTGIMASGKSTVAELLAREFDPAVHLRGDVFRRMIVSGRAEMGPEPTAQALEQLRLRYRLAAQAAQTYHAQGMTVVVQDNYLGEMLAYFVDLLKPAPVQVIVLNPRPEVILAREAGRGKTGYHSFSVEALHRDFIETTPPLGLWIDSSEQTPQETVAEILTRLGEKPGG